MRYLLLPLLILFTTFQADAQNAGFSDAELVELSSNVNSDYYITNQALRITGHPYFNKDWLKGNVQINEKSETENLLLRLNIQDNVLEFSRGQKLYIMDSKKISGFTLFGNPDDVVFRNGFRSQKHGITASTFLRVIYAGDVKLLAHHTASLKKDLPAYGSATKEARFVDDIDFLLVDASGKMSEVRLRKKDILRAMERGLRSEVEKFAKAKSYSFKDENGLKSILAHYDKLLAGS